MQNERLPLYAFGDGLRRWFHLIGQMIVYRDSVHCIEEIDATFHPGAYEQLSQRLVLYAKEFNNQVFLTSHSIEFTDSFLNALYGDNGLVEESEEDPVRIYTLKRPIGGELEVWPLSGREAFEKRLKFGIDLRG